MNTVHTTTDRPGSTEQGKIGAHASAFNWFEPRPDRTRPDDLALLLLSDRKRYLLRLKPRQKFHSHRGAFEHNDLIGKSWGALVESKLGQQAVILSPSLDDLIMHLKRGTQIIYPKDAAYLVHRLGLRSGCRVLEAGTGSAGLTTALAWSVAPAGRVYTYEDRPEHYQVARKNLERVEMMPYVEMHQHSIRDGFFQTDADALVLDVRHPWRYVRQARDALRPGGLFASLVPTTNQVSELLMMLESHAFADISVEELLLRRYKAVPERLRPEDQMVAHTGFLIFARAVDERLDPAKWQSKERQRYQARAQAKAELAKREAQQERERSTASPIQLGALTSGATNVFSRLSRWLGLR